MNIRHRAIGTNYLHTAGIIGVGVTLDGTSAISASPSEVVVWDAKTMRPKHCLAFDGSGHETLRGVGFLPSGKAIVAFGRHIAIFEPDEWWEPKKFVSQDERITCLATPQVTGNTFATGGEDGTLKLWRGGWPYKSIKAHTGPILSLAYSSCGMHLASGGSRTDPIIHEWGVLNGNPIKRYTMDCDDIIALAYSMDGDYLVSASIDGRLCVSDRHDKHQWPWEAERRPVRALEFSRNNKLLELYQDRLRECSVHPYLFTTRNMFEHQDAQVLAVSKGSGGMVVCGTAQGKVLFLPKGQ